MSKKHRKISPELPRVGNALEVPNYVIPTTDLEYKQTVEQTAHPDRTAAPDEPPAEDCGH